MDSSCDGSTVVLGSFGCAGESYLVCIFFDLVQGLSPPPFSQEFLDRNPGSNIRGLSRKLVNHRVPHIFSHHFYNFN